MGKGTGNGGVGGYKANPRSDHAVQTDADADASASRYRRKSTTRRQGTADLAPDALLASNLEETRHLTRRHFGSAPMSPPSKGQSTTRGEIGGEPLDGASPTFLL